MSTRPYSVADAIRAQVAETWGKQRSYEHEIHDRLCVLHGEPSGNGGIRIPHTALICRDLTVSSSGGAGHLVGTDVGGYIETLQPASVTLTLGAQRVQVGPGNHTYPRGSGSGTTQWLTNEATAPTESTPSVGSIAATPKLLSALVEVSRKILLQSNAEEVLRAELRNAAAAAVDAAVLGGSGTNGEPLGILNTPGIGAVTGTSLAYAGVVELQTDVGTANGVINRGALGYVSTPAIAGTLKQRQRVADTDSPLWAGDANDGSIDGKRALSTTGCPADALVYGDWSGVAVLGWDTVEIASNPFTKWQQGLVQIRLLLPVDVIVMRPASFSAATSIT